MNIFNSFREKLNRIIEDLQRQGVIPSDVEISGISVEPPREAKHGDLSTNAALVLAKQAKGNPREFAGSLAPRLMKINGVISVDIAGPGFLNVFFGLGFWHNLLRDVLNSGTNFGRSQIGRGNSILVEFVSANPTGPLHVGHARGAVYGDVLARLLSFSGFNVAREYYWNDAGAQVDKLAASVYTRYLQKLDATDPAEPGDDNGAEVEYGGEYLIDLAGDLVERHGEKWRDVPRRDWLPIVREISIEAMKDLIRSDLRLLGTTFDNEVSESKLLSDGKVHAAVSNLKSKGLIYEGRLKPPKGKRRDWEERDQILFRATLFGDEVDRPLQKSDGTWTYFASDIAYHFDKFCRGYDKMVNIWGADHGGYVSRVKAAVSALTEDAAKLEVRLCQMVRLFDGGDPIKMSKRSGSFITVSELIEVMDKKVGTGLGQGVVRFIMLTRKNDAPLDFDFAKAAEQSRDNPMFYVQYAHARICSVNRRVESNPNLCKLASAADIERLVQPEELALIKLIADWPRQVEAAAVAYEPHRIVVYLNDLASAFHALWNKGNNNLDSRFIVETDPSLTRARLGLISAVRIIISGGLETLLGITPQYEMR